MFRDGLSLLSTLTDMRRDLDRVFDGLQLMPARSFFDARATFPALNVWDHGAELVIEAEIPGVKREDLDISVIGNELTLRGRRVPVNGENTTYHRRERSIGEFTRTITLGADINADKVEALLKDGVLTLRLPKAESAKPRQIAVKTS
ncbi:MAG: Hsp20/alpha crystallin family protein [Phycisphaerae bacterium]